MMSEGNGLFNKDALLGQAKRRFATVEIEGLGKVRIRSLTELERSRIEGSMLDKKGQISGAKLVDMKCRLIVACVVDGDGNPIYSNGDINHIGQQDSKITNLIDDAIRAHCGWNDDSLEDLEKNSEATAAASSQ